MMNAIYCQCCLMFNFALQNMRDIQVAQIKCESNFWIKLCCLYKKENKMTRELIKEKRNA